jgi:hypothetical protein
VIRLLRFGSALYKITTTRNQLITDQLMVILLHTPGDVLLQITAPLLSFELTPIFIQLLELRDRHVRVDLALTFQRCWI